MRANGPGTQGRAIHEIKLILPTVNQTARSGSSRDATGSGECVPRLSALRNRGSSADLSQNNASCLAVAPGTERARVHFADHGPSDQRPKAHQLPFSHGIEAFGARSKPVPSFNKQDLPQAESSEKRLVSPLFPAMTKETHFQKAPVNEQKLEWTPQEFFKHKISSRTEVLGIDLSFPVFRFCLVVFFPFSSFLWRDP
jgi:hypothetical protein